MEFHVVSKSNNRTHATFSVDASIYPERKQLVTDCVRVQPVVISLTSNNLSYARLGEMLRWYVVFPQMKQFNHQSNISGGMYIQSRMRPQSHTAITHNGESSQRGDSGSS